jgi:hypothetical protein
MNWNTKMVLVIMSDDPKYLFHNGIHLEGIQRDAVCDKIIEALECDTGPLIIHIGRQVNGETRVAS